jgi:AraC-like DNA-binding protein
MSKSGQVEPTVTLTRTLAPGATIATHQHRGNQIVYASSGVLSVQTEHGSWVAPATRAIWVPAGVRHHHRAYGSTSLHTVGLDRRLNPLRSTKPVVLSVGALLREVLIAYTGGGQSQGRRTHLRAVLVDELRASPRQGGVHLPVPRDPRLADVCALLAADPADTRSLAQLGRSVGVGRRTLTRLFADEFGMSFPQWRTQLRLHLALVLLAEGRSVTAAGRVCGWASTSAFIDVFRRHMGYTPGGRHPVRRATAPATGHLAP